MDPTHKAVNVVEEQQQTVVEVTAQQKIQKVKFILPMKVVCPVGVVKFSKILAKFWVKTSFSFMKHNSKEIKSF